MAAEEGGSTTDMVSHDQVVQAAWELISLHGEGAVRHATERVNMLRRAGPQPELDVALRVLSEVEKLG
jgi:hypothetical protein